MLDLNDLAWLIDQNLREIDNRYEKLKKSDPNISVQMINATTPAPDLVIREDTKPTIIHNMNPNTINNIPSRVGTFSVDGMTSNGSAAAWYSGGFTSYGSSSSSNNQSVGMYHHPGLMTNDMMLAPTAQFNMSGMWLNNNPNNSYNNM